MKPPSKFHPPAYTSLLQVWMEERGVTQASLAEKLGISRQATGELIRGRSAASRARRAQFGLFLKIPQREIHGYFDANGFAKRAPATESTGAAASAREA